MNIGRANKLPVMMMYEFAIEFFFPPYLSDKEAAINDESGPIIKLVRAMYRAN